MSKPEAAIIWSADISQSTNSTRYQRASTLNDEYDCDFYILGNADHSNNHKFDVSLHIKRAGVVSGLLFFLQVMYIVGVKKRDKYQIVHTSYHPLASIMGFLCNKTGLRWIHDIWDHPILTVPDLSEMTSLSNRLNYFLKYSAYKLSLWGMSDADEIILSLHPDILETLPVTENNVTHIPNGTNIDTYKDIQTTNSEGLNIIYVGTVSKNRGAKTMLRTAAYISKQESDLCLTLIGEIKDRKWLDDIIKEYRIENHVSLTGPVSHQTALKHVSKADIGLCLFPRSVETEYIYPIKVFEYMALETIPICSDLPGIAEVINDGESGYLVTPGDACETADTIISVPNSDYKEIVCNSLNAVEKYDWNYINKNFRNALQNQ